MKSLREIVGPYKETEPIIYDSDGIPLLECTWIPPNSWNARKEQYKNAGLWQFVCPSCKKTHTHGAGLEDDQSFGIKGHRMSHCIKKDKSGNRFFPKGYYLKYVSGYRPQESGIGRSD